MATYSVLIEQYCTSVVEVEADSEDDAATMAREGIDNGDIPLNEPHATVTFITKKDDDV